MHLAKQLLAARQPLVLRAEGDQAQLVRVEIREERHGGEKGDVVVQRQAGGPASPRQREQEALPVPL